MKLGRECDHGTSQPTFSLLQVRVESILMTEKGKIDTKLNLRKYVTIRRSPILVGSFDSLDLDISLTPFLHPLRGEIIKKF